MIKVEITPRFRRQLGQLPKEVRLDILEEIKLFQEDPLNPDLNGLYAISVADDLRIIFRFINKKHTTVTFYKIGTHEIYK